MPRTEIETPEFYDVGRIVDPESPVGIAFAERMQALTERLAGNRYDWTRHRARYLLADESSVNAYTIPSTEPPVIVIHRGLLEDAKSLDEVAGVLAHEWGHIFAQQELGEHRVGRAEESGADLMAVRLLAESGFDAKALENLLLRLNEATVREKPETLLQSILRVHPLSDNRANVLEKARILLNRSGFKTDHASTPMPDDLLSMAHQAQYVSNTDIYAKLKEADYSEKSIPEQLDILTHLAEQNAQIDRYGTNAAARDLYEWQIHDAFRQIDVATAPEAVKEAYHTAFSKIIKAGVWPEKSLNAFYRDGLIGLGKSTEQPWEPIGNFRQLRDVVTRFKSSQSAEDAVAAGTEIVNSYYDIGDGEDNKHQLMRNIDLGKISYPSVEEVRAALNKGDRVHIPFARHDQWHQELDENHPDYWEKPVIEDSVNILRGTFQDGILRKTGLENYDNSASEYYSRFNIQDGEIKSVWPDPVRLPEYPASLTERVNALSESPNVADYLKIEAEMIDHHSQWQRSVIAQGIHWDLLENHPEQFTRIYRDALRPLATSQPYEHPFAHAFIDHIQQRAQSHPEEMTFEKREQIYDRLASAPNINPDVSGLKRHSHPVYKKLIFGIDQDHPYIQERMGLMDAGIEPSIEPVLNVRINSFAPAESLKLQSQYFPDREQLDEARQFAEFRDHPPQPTASSLFDLLHLHDRVVLSKSGEYASEKLALLHSVEDAIHESFSLAEKTTSLPEMIKNYHIYGTKINLVFDLDARWQNHILSALSDLNPSERHEQLNALLDRHYGAKPASPELRSKLADLIVSDIFSEVGKDNSTPEFAEKAMAAIKAYSEPVGRSEPHIKGALRNLVIAQFAERSEAQPGFAAQLKRYYHVSMAPGDSLIERAEEGAAEHFYEKYKNDPVRRAAILEYLLKPETRESAERVAEQLYHDDSTSMHLSDLKNKHAEYWDMSMPARTAITNDLIFAPDTTPKTVKNITNRLLDRLMGQADSTPITSDLLTGKTDAQRGIVDAIGTRIRPDTSTQATARRIVDAYVDTVAAHDPKEARLLVSALMSAEHERAPGTPMRLGQTLHQVLSHMGPAGAKLLQAIHSHPNTPQDIRDDLKYSKIDHDKPLRWDAIDLARDAGLLDPTKTTHVGPVVGAGSFGITMFNTAPDGVTYADTLLRPRADAIAEREFNFMLKAAQIVANADSRMIPILDMIREGQHSARIETQMSLAAKQNQVAEQVMDGVQVTVRGEDGIERTSTHRVARLVEVGAGYKRAEVAQGEHFLDLSEGMPVEQRRAAVLSMAAMQLTQRMAGMPMDRDRHGGNIKLEGSDINHFDFGMTEVTLATEPQKKALGMVLAQAAKDTAGGGKFIDHLLARISKADVSPEARGFLAGFNREILALGDYFNALPTNAASSNEMTGILGHALYGEHTDPVIRAAFDKELGAIGRDRAESVFRAAMAESPVTITSVPRAADLRMPELTSEEHAIVQNRDYGLPNRLATQRLAIQSGVGNGLGVAMGAYGLYEKFHDQNSAYHQDINSNDAQRRLAAQAGVVGDVSNIVSGAAATAADAHIIHTSRVAPAAAVPSPHPNGKITSPTAAGEPHSTAGSGASGRAAGEVGRKTGERTGDALDEAAKAAREAAKKAAEAAEAAAQGAEGAAVAGSRAATVMRVGGKIAGRAAIPLAVAVGGVETYAATRAGDRDRATGAIGGTAGGIIGGIAAGAAAGALMGGAAGSVVPGIGTITVGVVAGIGGGLIGAFAGEAASKRFLSGAVGWVTGVDGKFQEAMKGLDPRVKAFLDQNHDGKRDVEDIHLILKRAGLDSIDKIDKNHDGKLSSAELNSALAGVIIDKELGEKLAEANAKGWGKALGNKDGKLTLDELKAALPKGLDLLSLDKNHNGDISGREISDALIAARSPPATPPAPPNPTAAVSARSIARH